LCTDHSLYVGYFLSHIFQLAFEQVAQLNRCHHLTGSINELHYNDTFIPEVLVELVVLFL
jgi:hypothetical protein